ncbi:MAG: chorismate-binding protein, partial [Acidimicrobiia bacterium]|nr:chorismate-binding protein [Acidimicrobiia bacterium]
GLRCGLVRGLRTHLFAGAGIVDGSDPAAEVEETRLKLVPLLRLLTAP